MRGPAGAGILVAAIWLCAAAAPRAQAAPALVEPVSGGTVAVETGASALHLVFFATWCKSCVDDLARLGELEARWSGRGYRLVIVAVRERQSADQLARFLESKDPPGRLLFDAKGEAERAWKAKWLPTHLVLDASGREIARAGALNGEIEEAIAGLLVGKRGGERGR